MAEIDISSAIGSGFGLIRGRPMAVVAWGVLLVGFFALTLALILPAFFAFATMPARTGEGPSDTTAIFAELARFQGVNLLMQCGLLILQTVVTAAIFRAILHPEMDAWAYLRFGRAELYLGLMVFGIRFALAFAVLFAAAPFIFITAALVLAHSMVAAAVVGVTGAALIATVSIWLALRFSLAGPMIVADNEFRLIESWRLTKGHAGELFLMTLWLVVILVAVELVIYALCGALVLANLSAVPGGIERLRRLTFESIGPLLNALMPSLILVGLVGTLFTGVILTIFTAPWAAVYRQLAPAEPTAA
jgi:hypothetical protein